MVAVRSQIHEFRSDKALGHRGQRWQGAETVDGCASRHKLQ